MRRRSQKAATSARTKPRREDTSASPRCLLVLAFFLLSLRACLKIHLQPLEKRHEFRTMSTLLDKLSTHVSEKPTTALLHRWIALHGDSALFEPAREEGKNIYLGLEATDRWIRSSWGTYAPSSDR